MTAALAVIELGSASTRMLIVDADGVSHHWQVTTTMAQGLARDGSLGLEALLRVKDCLIDYRQVCASRGARVAAVAASEAARVASNSSELCDIVSGIFDVELQILASEKEAQLAFDGATAGLEQDTQVLLIDVGGASTEFVVGVTGSGHLDSFSIPVGAVQVSESYIESDPPDPAELSSALSVVATHIEDVIRLLPTVVSAAAHGKIIAVGGTATTAAAVEIGLADYSRHAIQGFVLDRPAVEDVFRTLATEDEQDRAFNPGLAPDRVPLIVGGLCVLVAIMRHLIIGEIIVSENDLLEGLMAQTDER